MNRRFFLRATARLAATAATGSLAAACTQAPVCEDVSALSTPDQIRRTSMKYVSVSPDGDAKACRNCKFFKAAAERSCGTCALVPGPIAPGGRCNLWVAA